MGYGMYGSGGSYSAFGSYTTRSSVRSSGIAPGSRSYAASVTGTRASSASPNTTQQSASQKTASQESAMHKMSEQKSTGKKNSEKSQKNKSEQKTSQKSSSKKSSKKSTTQKVSEQKTSEQHITEPKSVDVKTSVQKTSSSISSKTSSEHNVSAPKTTSKQEITKKVIVQKVIGETETVKQETNGGSGIIVYTEGTFLVKKDKPKPVEPTAEKTPAELKQEKDQARKDIKQKDLHDMELQVTKHPKFLALQDKLNERLSKRSGKESGGESKVKPPTGYVTYGLVTIKNIASFLELSLSNEEATLNTLEDIHDLLDKEFKSHNVYKIEAELGKFLLATKSVDEMINLAMKIQVKFNEHTWNDKILALPMFRKLLRPEDLLNDDAVPLFNGPRLSIGVHAGEATTEENESGHKRYCGMNIVQVETIGKFAQGGQVLISSNAWTKVNQSKLSKHHMNRLGVFKLDDFTTGCSLVEITPDVLQERAKFYGAICSHCSKGIQPWEKSFEKLQCTWHEDHFKCFNCGKTVGEGTYAAYQGLPHCHSCYLSSNPKPKCKKCMNPIAKDYINALGSYFHANCFSCKQCRKRPTPETPLRSHKDDPYCYTCYEKVVKI